MTDETDSSSGKERIASISPLRQQYRRDSGRCRSIGMGR
jgi:hypothetical protein